MTCPLDLPDIQSSEKVNFTIKVLFLGSNTEVVKFDKDAPIGLIQFSRGSL